MSGEGTAELRISDHREEYADEDWFEVVPNTGLSNGDVVTVKGKAAAGWRFEPAEKQFTVDGLTAWVLSIDQLAGDNLAAVHSNTERLIREDGTVYTGYEACRYSDLRIPADGVLKAHYGTLQGFNFGFSQGFSYAHSFAGWTDAAQMEADLRNVRENYQLADVKGTDPEDEPDLHEGGAGK